MKSPVSRKTLNSALKGLIDRLEKTEKFALDQAPDICKQMIRADLQENYIYGAFAVLVFIASIVGIVYSAHVGILSETMHGDTEPTRYLFLLLTCSISAIVSAIGSLEYVNNLLYISNCPKLFLLREFKRLVK